MTADVWEAVIWRWSLQQLLIRNSKTGPAWPTDGSHLPPSAAFSSRRFSEAVCFWADLEAAEPGSTEGKTATSPDQEDLIKKERKRHNIRTSQGAESVSCFKTNRKHMIYFFVRFVFFSQAFHKY